MVAICCLLGSGLSAIFIASHVGSRAVKFNQAHDLWTYLALAFWIYALFYVEHRLLRRFMSRPLDDGLGYWQALGSLALTVVGALGTVVSTGLVDFPATMLWVAGMFGEAVLVLNVVRAYSRDEVAGAIATPVPRKQLDSGPDNFGWPESPAKLFVIGAGLLAAGGVVSIVFNFPAMKLPVPFAGQVYFLPFGCLWMLTALPFAIYSRLYERLMSAYRIEFDQSMTRIHFLVTSVAVVILIKDFESWQRALASPMAAPYLTPDVEMLAAPFLLSAIVFMLTLYRSLSRVHQRSLVKRPR